MKKTLPQYLQVPNSNAAAESMVSFLSVRFTRVDFSGFKWTFWLGNKDRYAPSAAFKNIWYRADSKGNNSSP